MKNKKNTQRPQIWRRAGGQFFHLALALSLSFGACANVKGLFTKDGGPGGGHPACIGYGDETAMPTEEGTFILCLPAHLSLIGSGDYELSADYILGNNLNLNNEDFTPIGDGGGTSFTGSFDGQNRKIQNLKISVSTNRAGLFEELGADGLIQNLALEGGNVESTNTSGTNIGALVARMSGGEIRDSYATASLNGESGERDYVGGLVGQQSGGSIIASYATCKADGGDGQYGYVGGLVGQQSDGRIIASYATCKADGGDGSQDRVGGLVGQQSGGRIIASYATGKADGGDGSQDRVGGLVGQQSGGSIIASYATGNADGGGGASDYVGGLVGQQNSGSIIASYATGKADGGNGELDSVGGLLGQQSSEMGGGGDGRIIASYATGDANGGGGTDDSAAGLVGFRAAGGTPASIASYGFGMLTGEDMSSGTDGNPPASAGDSASGLTTDNANDPPMTAMQWTGDNSPWSFGGGPPRLGYITWASISGDDVMYECEADELIEGIACGDLLPGQ